MNESLLRQANQADMAYHRALERNAPDLEQIRLLEQWCRLYYQLPSHARRNIIDVKEKYYPVFVTP